MNTTGNCRDHATKQVCKGRQVVELRYWYG
jgi:hypothetical protein